MANPDKLAAAVQDANKPADESSEQQLATEQQTAASTTALEGSATKETSGEDAAPSQPAGDASALAADGSNSALTAELKAAAVDAALAAEKPHVETVGGIPPVVEQATKVRETTAVTSNEPTVERASGSASANALMEQWKAYAIAADKRKVLTPTQLLLQQRGVMRLIKSTANLDENQDFAQVSNYLIGLINENKTGAFTGGVIFRLFDTGIESEATTNKARFALDAYLLFAEPKVRQANINTYNLANSALIADTPEKRDRFVAYFRRISGNR